MAKSDGEGAATTTKSTTVTFKVSVLRSRKTGRVLFVEAGKDFVDTLFSFLLLPVGTIIHMLATAGGQEMAFGGFYSIFKSVEKLDSSFMHVDKESLLQPRPAVAGTSGSISLLQGLETAEMQRPTLANLQLPKIYYRCDSATHPMSNYCKNLSITSGGACDQCGGRFQTAMAVLPKDLRKLKADIIEELEEDSDEEAGGEGFVSENTTYMVTDNLEIMPSTTIRSINVLNNLRVATLADLESNDIIVSTTQILQLMQSARTSHSCLNDVFGMMFR